MIILEIIIWIPLVLCVIVALSVGGAWIAAHLDPRTKLTAGSPAAGQPRAAPRQGRC
jgi:hypothetical protein